jgi:hypothetical protein
MISESGFQDLISGRDYIFLFFTSSIQDMGPTSLPVQRAVGPDCDVKLKIRFVLMPLC